MSSLPIALGAKSVSSRPLVMADKYDELLYNKEEEEHEYVADDGMTRLDPVLVPGAPLTAMAVCPKQEWLASANLQYYDMMMVVEDDDGDEEEQKGTRRRRLARHSTIAEVRIQISPLSLPFSSRYREVLHRLDLPPLPTSKQHHAHHHHKHHTHKQQHGQPKQQQQQQRYLDEEYLEQSERHSTPIQPSLVFSSDRRTLACLIPYPRGGHHSCLVAFTLQRATPHRAPLPRPAIPSYIPTSSNPTAPPSHQSSSTSSIPPEASGEPQWLRLPPHAALDLRQHAMYWLHNITSLCDSSTQTKRRITAKGSSVLLAGCRDGSLLGISFTPLVLAGILYHPTQGRNGDGSVTFLSHLTTSNVNDKNNGEKESSSSGSVLGKLVAVRESGKACLFQTRMVLSSLNYEDDNDGDNDDDDDEGHHYLHLLDESVSALNDGDDMDASEYGTSGVMMIHGESFHVVKTGRRNSLPANARLSLEQDPQHGLHHHHHQQHNKHQQIHNDNDHDPVGTTGLVMYLEPLSEIEGNVSRAQWLTGSLLVALDNVSAPNEAKRQSVSKSQKMQDTKHQVAQVFGILPGRPPECLSELNLTPEDLQEHSHTTFSLDEEVSRRTSTDDSSATPKNPLLTRNISHLLEASLGIHVDPLTGCLAISSARILPKPKTSKKKDDPASQTDSNSAKGPEAKIFVCLWQWRPNVVGFTAVTTKAIGSHHVRPISRVFFAKDKLSNARRIAHIHSAGGDGGFDRIRKDLFEMGVLSPPQDIQRSNGWGVQEASPVLLTPSSVSFSMVTEAPSQASEVEWVQSAIPINYRLDYGAPVIAAMGSKGRSIAIASSRGLCVLECSPKPKKREEKERTYLFPEYESSAQGDNKQSTSRKTGASYALPPKWHLFGNELEERSFRVIAMTWWQGVEARGAEERHTCDDLLLAIIQLQSEDDNQDSFYLACWSPRSLDAAHQRLRPLDDDLHASRRRWGVRLPIDFRPKALKLVSQPYRNGRDESDSSTMKKPMERKAVVLLTSEEGQSGSVEFLMYQLQGIPSMRLQDSASYEEQNPYSILSLCCSKGEIPQGPPGSFVSGIFLAGASFQFDLVRQKSKTSGGAPSRRQANEIIGTVGVFRSPGCGLDAIVVTSVGISKVVSVFNYGVNGSQLLALDKDLKSSEASSFWSSDFVYGSRSISTKYGEHTLIDLFVWTIQLADGKLLCWFVPCLGFHSFPSESQGKESNQESPNVFSSRVMFGTVCPIGSSTTWLQQSAVKTGREFMVGCLARSPHGCFLSTGQSSRRYHRSIAGDFDHTLFAPDFLEHEYLYPSDFSLSPPAFMSSAAALIHCEVYLLLARSNNESLRGQKNGQHMVNAGGEDMENAILAIDTSEHMQRLSQIHQDAAFMALRLLLLRSVEQLADDRNKKRASKKSPSKTSHLSASVLSEVLHVVKSCTSSRLQFASLLLEVGRQLEPSCFPHLFPLPLDAPLQIIMTRYKDSIDLRTVADLFDACVDDGSLLSSVSSLPIIRKKSLSRRNSILILNHCLRALMENTKSEDNLFFDFSAVERSALNDVFRFGVKLEDSGSDDFTEEVYGSADVSDDDSDDDDRGRRKGSGITCGIFSNIFSRKPDPASQRLIKPERVRSQDNRSSDESEDASFAGAVATTLVELVFPDESSHVTRAHSWKRSATIAYLLLGTDKALLPRLSAKGCTSLAKTTGKISKVDRITTLLARSIVACRDEITASAAERILDLVLVLLCRCSVSSDLDSTIPGLLVVGIAASHVCGKVNKILNTSDTSVSFAKAYLDAKEKAANMGSC